MEKINLKRKLLQNTSLSEKELSVILGGLLGHGSLKIYPGYKDARYAFPGRAKQKEYFNAKCKQLQPLGSPDSVRLENANRCSSLQKLRFSTRALPALTAVHFMTHRGKKLQIKRRWLNHCTAQSLAIWWFDDGSIIGGGRRGCISTEKFSEQECNILIKYLALLWGVKARLGYVTARGRIWNHSSRVDRNRHCWRLYLSTRQLQTFLTIVLPHCPCASMIYKCTLQYADLHLQERWISHMKKHLSPELRPLLKQCT